MENSSTSAGHFVAAIIGFCLVAAMAIMLLIAALVVWLSELFGSFLLAAFIVGCFLSLVATIIYLKSIRSAIESIRTQMETIYDVARLAKEGYDWVREKLLLLMLLREKMQKK